MKISRKLTFGFVSIALMITVIGYISINASQKVLQKIIGKSSITLAAKWKPE
jgi:hypothetical protein